MSFTLRSVGQLHMLVTCLLHACMFGWLRDLHHLASLKRHDVSSSHVAEMHDGSLDGSLLLIG